MPYRVLVSYVIRLTPIFILLAGCSGCEDPEKNYGDTHIDVTDMSGFYWPTTGKVVQDFFGDKSIPEAGHWYDQDGALKYHQGGSNFHRGIDIENARGTRVFAAHAGTAFIYPNQEGSGNTIIVRNHSNGTHTIYCHLDSLAVGNGAHVTPNSVIGAMGDSGGQRRVHLHFNYMLRHGDGWADYWTPGKVGDLYGSGEPMQNPIR